MSNNFDNRYGETGKTEWLTPPDIIRALGEFDLDVSAPVNPPWATAKNHYTEQDDGLSKNWFGRVWMNPPYTLNTWRWMKRLAEHGDGMALIFARTETKAFFPYVWEKASGIFFFGKRLTFHNVDGTPGKRNSGAPSVLIAYGKDNARILENFKLYKGIFLPLNQ